MLLSRDWREFLLALNSHGVEYVLVGGLAMGFHAEPRFTGDMDVLVRPTPENAKRVLAALDTFGLGSLGVTAADILQIGSWLQFGVRPYRIDLLNSITGVDTDEIWRRRVPVNIDGIPIFVIDKESLLRNKLAAGRPKDLSDAAILEDD